MAGLFMFLAFPLGSLGSDLGTPTHRSGKVFLSTSDMQIVQT